MADGIKAKDLPIVNSIENNSYLMAITDMTENNQVKNISKGDFMADIVSYDENNQLILGGDGRLLVVNSGQIQSDWEQTDNTQKDYIKNKPDLALKQDTSEKAQALGYAPLDEDAKVPIEYLPYLPETSVLTPFTANSGKVNSNGDSDIASASGGTMSFNVDLDNPLVATPANSQPTFTRTSIPDLDMSGYADGTYNVFVGKTGNAQAYTNTIFAQAAQPVPEAAFIQPTLSSNGTLGGSAFACAASSILGSEADAFNALDGNYPSVGWHSANGSSWWFKIYNPLALNITNFQIRNSNDSAHKAITAGNVQGSNDGTSWITITTWTNSNTTVNSTWNISLSSNTNYYKYYLINITSSAYSGYAVISEIAITATFGNAIANDIWLDTSVEPLKSYKYDGSAWEEFNLVPIDSITVVDGTITSVKNFDFNYNGYDLKNVLATRRMISDWDTPNYSQRVSKAWGITHTAEKNGYVQALGSTFHDAVMNLYIDGDIRWYSSPHNCDLHTTSPFMKISKGSVYMGVGGSTFQNLWFYSSKGGN